MEDGGCCRWKIEVVDDGKLRSWVMKTGGCERCRLEVVGGGRT
jgi:hypothetical protein